MAKSKIADFFRRHFDVTFFVISWMCGLLTGAFAAGFTDPIFLSGVHRAVERSVSIPGSFIAAVLPFFVVSYAVLISKPKWILPIAFVKAFGFSFVGFLIHMAFGSAGWLVRGFLQFSGICAAPVFCWFGIRQISGKQRLVRRDLRFVCIIMAAIAAVDYFLVSPYLLHLTAT